MKKFWWAMIGLGVTFFILLIMLFIPIIWLDRSWRWLWITAIVEAIIWACIGLLLLLLSLRKRPPAVEKLNITNEKERARHFVLMDNDNPDNFIIKKTIEGREGEPGKERTPVVAFRGEGTEVNSNINVIVNLNNPKGETIRQDGISEEEVIEAMRKIAEYPEIKTTDEIVRGIDQFGRPTETTRTTRSSATEKKEQEEKDKAERSSAL